MLSKRRRIVNFVMLSATGVCALLSVSLLLFILGFLFFRGGSSLTLDFFTQLPKPVGETGGGMANALVGSGKLLLIAMLFGIPVGFLGGVYLAEFGGSRFAFIVRYTTDLLNGVPSIVMGIFAYTILVVPRGHFSTLSGGLALGVMMIPIAIRSSEDFLRAVPVSLREGSMALGASKARSIITVVIPAAKNGILTGIMLNMARVAGETAPLLFTSLSNQFWSPGWDQPTAALPVMIYQYAISPYADLHRQAWSAGFVLLMLVLGINVTARLLLSQKQQAR